MTIIAQQRFRRGLFHQVSELPSQSPGISLDDWYIADMQAPPKVLPAHPCLEEVIHSLKYIWPWELLPAASIYRHRSFDLCLSRFPSIQSCHFWNEVSFDNSWQNRSSLLKLIYRTILVAQRSKATLLGLSLMCQKGYFFGQSRKGEESMLSHPLAEGRGAFPIRSC